MDIRLLGPIEARLDGHPIALGARKQRAVLAMLALRVGRTVSADRLAEGLWGERLPLSAHKMVQLYVSHLRGLLAENGAEILTRGRGYELRLADGDVDAVQFEQLLESSRAREALALWGGEPLADVADEPFAADEIRRLEELRVRAAEAAIDADLVAGRHAAVIGELDALVAEHPLREALHGQRMLALYRSGRQAEALQAYHDARATLVEQVGVEPGPELRMLQQAILDQDPSLAAAPSSRAPPPVAPRRGRRVATPVLIVAVLTVCAGLVVFGISRLTRPDRLPRIDENAVGEIDAADGRIVEQHSVGRGPGAVVAGGGSVWVANALDGTVSRIDREGDQFLIDVKGEPTGLAYGGGALWVANGETRTVAQIDPGTNRVLRELGVGNASRAIAAGFGAVWVASGSDGTVRRIDLRDPERRRAIPVGSNPTAIAAGAGALWVASEEAGTVSRLDPRTGAVRAIPVGNGPSAVAAGAGGVYVVNRPDGTVTRIDPATNAIAWTFGVGADPAAIAVDGGDVWVAGGADGTVTRIDAREPRELDQTEVESSADAVAVADGSVWVAAGPPPAGHRGGTIRLLVGNSQLPIDWLDAGAYDLHSWELISLAYDGLVAYRRVAGAAGATLVGALATEAPRPGPDGRSYAFTLRPGLRYSDGTPVRPVDFRASLERYLRVTRDEFPPFFTGIVGAERCVTRPARCDLSEGIETDSRARTITVHLTGPDAAFLHKLTLPFAYVVPSDTPARPTGDHAPPGTGPYRFDVWDAKRGGRLVRNPRFDSWSPQARPAGLADRIDVSAREVKNIGPRVAAVERGEADLVTLQDAYRGPGAAARLAAISVRSPGRLHSDPIPFTDYFFLNTSRPPFDELSARQALNFATDRARLIALAGGPTVAATTCQLLPTGFPGHEPYCPYTADAGPGRPWSAPDMERARALVAASGTAGTRVIVRAPDYARSFGRYFARLLDELGYRAELVVLGGDVYDAKVQDPQTHAQIGFAGWFADYATPSNFIEPLFTCGSQAAPRPENLSYFCDRAAARQAVLAHAAQGGEATRRWTAIDHRIADLAPLVPMTNRRALVFVSTRIRNMRQHVMGYILLDQLWVR